MTPKENILRAIRRDHPQWVPNGMENVVWIHPPVVERPNQAGFDAFGVHWSYEPGAEGGTFPTRGGPAITDVKHWREQIRVPDLSKLDWTGIKSRAANIDRNENLVQGFVEMGLFERSYLLLGMEEALMAYLTDPDDMADLAAALADYKIDLITRFHEAIGMDILWYGDDWGTQQDLFIPPDVWRKIIKPHTKRIYDAARTRGIIVNQHSCGRIEAVFADMVQIGAQMWNNCQPCNDLARLKRRFGNRITFCGGIDSQFVLDRPGITAAQVRAEVRRRIDELAAGGGYIAAPSHGVPFEPELIAAMNDEINQYGREVYRS